MRAAQYANPGEAAGGRIKKRSGAQKAGSGG
jgi:hypothetical protein